ncbi:MAG: response regulator [Actinobacteria bacterium]|nr:response regulator [Actinomycetota bacterium]
MERAISVLLVEDNAHDVRLVADALTEAPGPPIHLDRVDRLSGAIDGLRQRATGVVLLDLNLPDSKGLDTLVVLRTHAPRTAIVVLTVNDGEEGLKAVRAGAQDYLMKDRFDADLLARSLRYAFERQALLNRLEARKAREAREAEISMLMSFSEGVENPVLRRLAGVPSLRQTSRDVFSGLVRLYGDMLTDLASADRASMPLAVAGQIDDVARRLGVLNAGPDDAAEVHAMALEVKGRVLDADEFARIKGRSNEALVELMSRLAAHYRRYTVEARELTG